MLSIDALLTLAKTISSSEEVEIQFKIQFRTLFKRKSIFKVFMLSIDALLTLARSYIEEMSTEALVKNQYSI